MTSGVSFEDEDPARQKFKRSCAGIIPLLAISCAATLAENMVLEAHHDELKDTAEATIKAIYAGTPIVIEQSERPLRPRPPHG